MAGGVLRCSAFPSSSGGGRNHAERVPTSPRAISGGGSSSRKHAERLLFSLQAISPSDPDAAAASERLIRKFVASSSKSTALHALSHLLSLPHSSRLALSMYRSVSEAAWFEWNPKLAASIVPLLEKLGRSEEAETLILESISRSSKPREIALFHCDLIECYARNGLKDKVFDAYSRLQELQLPTVISRKACESMVKALCHLDLPGEAEDMAMKPSSFEYRLLAQAYGRSKQFDEMRRILDAMEDAGCALDTIAANVILSCYGDHGELQEMYSWLRKVRDSSLPLSVRTYNAVLNSCSTVVSMLQDLKSLPLSVATLTEKLQESSPEEASLVGELVRSEEVLLAALEWSPAEGKLDLHGFHLGSAYLIVLQWAEEVKARLLLAGRGDCGSVPMEIVIVCGLGKHSNKRGESPVRGMVSEMMFRMGSPLRMDRKNAGRFVARRKAAIDWLCRLN